MHEKLDDDSQCLSDDTDTEISTQVSFAYNVVKMFNRGNTLGMVKKKKIVRLKIGYTLTSFIQFSFKLISLSYHVATAQYMRYRNKLTALISV